MECNGRNYTQPVTILELDVSTTDDDFYNVSLMKGFNLPMTIEPIPGDSCLIMGCVNNLNERCPPELQLEGGGGCKSACQLYGSPEYCCLKSIETNCSVTKYGRLFESACPNTVTYETNDLGIYSCRDADYTVRFCPPSDTFSTAKLDRLLQYGEQLVSKNGKFELFFYTYDTNSPYGIYLAISSLTNDQTVWVANPNTPIISTLNEDIFLSIDPNTGNLVVTSEHKTLMRITDVEAGVNPNVTATLEDNGNFRLINETNKRVLWESFDHPTDVLLPGMKLGYDLTTGHNWTLTSSLSEENSEPAGAFTLSWEPTEQRLVIQRRNQPYWTSGKIKDQQFPNLFELNNPNSEAKYKLTSVYDNTVGYFSYSVDQDLGSEDDNGPTPMWRLKANGQIEDVSNSALWTPEFCYGLESNMGCMEDSTLQQCRGEKNSFIHQYGSFDPHMTSSTTKGNSSLSISDCFVKCWNECECVGFNSSNTDGTGCTILKGSNSFSLDPRKNSTWAYVIISQNPNNPTSRNKDENKMQLIWILIGSTIPLILLCLGLLWCRKKREHIREEKERRKRDEYFLELTASESFKDVHQLEGNGGKGSDLLVFSVASAWELWQRGDALELKDPMLGSTCDVQQFLRTVHVALLCVQDSATDRPTTSDMISMLLNDTILLPTPNTPPSAMVRAQSMSTSDERKPKPMDLSINNISITVMDGR
ncbi:Apple-like protein [Artemisia annua]|uniref:Apple-like protein n=1 Tax=Artemisia annua TaxID=35608 RepID=A0A2U1KH62_ARTAN|nr:Apple-like protein [Artemisia annua]